MALAAALGATALLTAAPAVADDETFLDVLDMMGVPVTDPASAVEMGHTACAGLDQGQSVDAVAAALGPANGLTLEQSGMVIGASVAAYCDQHRALVGG
ncbi:hypothetical protein A4X20_09635 [Mycolicibacterium iranicum]|uniref:DUF732 domain-containing protein n=2 Tax=Mycolicibacterium iranicum TaxID=912594 RepID=A0A178LJE8_MYCIR|nr:hypothetical protein A4X20_09635 [Mycolicibacterium iranicum]